MKLWSNYASEFFSKTTYNRYIDRRQMYKIAIDKTEVNSLPQVVFPGKVVVIDSMFQLKAAVDGRSRFVDDGLCFQSCRLQSSVRTE